MPIFKTITKSERPDLLVPIKIWTGDLEDSAKDQLINTAKLPFVFKHVAVMPDVHAGIGATVGTVIATKDAVCPAAVGVDIGCGMMAAKLDIEPARVTDSLKKIRHSIERSVPVGRDGNKSITKTVEAWEGWKKFKELSAFGDSKNMLERATSQLGSLGGGNHFIEVCLDDAGEVWVLLHSGSRNIGKEVAEKHIGRAKSAVRDLALRLPDPNLAFFTRHTPEFAAYIRDLRWCQDYAWANRHEMMRRVLTDISHAVGEGGKPLAVSMEINCHHNYVAAETHFGEEVLVTRKGAVRAGRGELGIIPGSMGTRSYIVRGLGNADSFESCSHGAGRRMSRGDAKRRFKISDLEYQTRGVECRKDAGVLDEIPGAYKDIDQVMENQRDLVEVVACLKQVLCVKG